MLYLTLSRGRAGREQFPQEEAGFCVVTVSFCVQAQVISLWPVEWVQGQTQEVQKEIVTLHEPRPVQAPSTWSTYPQFLILLWCFLYSYRFYSK